jgi:3-oxo-5alpha-steroid 4-dehydrogenase
MNSVYVARNIAPPPALLDGVIVNHEGRRFVNEDAYTGSVGLAISKQTDGNAWLILPAGTFRKAVAQALTCGWHLFKFFGLPALLNIALGGTRYGRTIEGVAKACGVNPEALRATIEAHDRALRDSAPDPVGKNDTCRAALGEGPFFAVNVSISNPHAFTPFMTLGGLAVDEETGAVMRQDGSAIRGLYAAGLCAVGLHSNGYISGISLSDVFSGRRAGRAAAQVLGQAKASIRLSA